MSFEMTVTLPSICPDSIEEHVRTEGYPIELVSKITIDGLDVELEVQAVDTPELRLELTAMLNKHDGILCQKKKYVRRMALRRYKQVSQLRDLESELDFAIYRKALKELGGSIDYSAYTLKEIQDAYPLHAAPWPAPSQFILDTGVLV